jgi:C-terminal processing protease CtpA/Prc
MIRLLLILCCVASATQNKTAPHKKTKPIPPAVVDDGKFGIGATLEQNMSRSIVIRSIATQSPAAVAGLQPNDIILSVQVEPGAETVSLTDKTPYEADELIRGRRGTQVLLKVMKPSGEERTAIITRDELPPPPK